MKIIALIPVKNEGWILKVTIPQLKKFADEILCLDAGSADDTLAYLKSVNVSVRQQTETKINFSSWRQELLEWGRERGGTHFIWLDADEAFTTNFLGTGKNQIPFLERLAQMKPGEKLSLEWLCLWKSPYVYREDNSVWTHLYKDFIVCDDGKISFDSTALHEGRTPGPNTNSDGTISWTKVPLDEGGVLHFQFVPFERYQVKQAHQRCRERFMGTASPRRINNKYSVTLDDSNAQTKPIPADWFAGISGLDTISSARDSWFLNTITDYFKEKGILYFEPIQIWHVRELKKMFVDQIGREPVPKTYPAFVIRVKRLLDATKKHI